MELTSDERRVVGTLIEKGYTTPQQYPLTMNSLVTGSNQKSCRSPTTQLDEERVFLAIDGLRKKMLCTLVQMQGSHTDRFKHRLSETMELEDREIAILGELLLRGPQTDGELRQRANRMVKFDSLDTVGECLARLLGRDPPLVHRLSAEGRKRGVRYAHGLGSPEELERLIRQEESAANEAPSSDGGELSGTGGPASLLREELETLRSRVSELEARLARIEQDLGT